MLSWLTGSDETEENFKMNENLSKLINQKINSYEPPNSDDFESFIKEITTTDDSWSLVAVNEVGKIYKQNSDSYTINIIKGNVDWEEKAQTIFSLLKDDEFYIKSSTDTYFLDWKLIEKIDENTHISYCKL